MQLYDAGLSPNCLRVRAVANELEIELELIAVDIFKGETKTEAFAARNANSKVPVLVDGDFTLWESRAIMSYLCGVRPEHGLVPDDVKGRALVDQWSYWQAIHLGPAMQKVGFERVFKPRFGMGEANPEAVAAGLKDCDQFLAVLEDNLGSKEWVTGALSMVDFAVASTFPFREPADISLDALPRTAAWIERLEARPSWQKAVEPVEAFLRG